MKGKKNSADHDAYRAAKHGYDLDAADVVVQRSLARSTIDSIVAHVVVSGLNGRIIMPHPAFDDEDGIKCLSHGDRPNNAIPFAYANYLSALTGLPVDEEIVQAARVGRTKLGKCARFLYQPTFGGAVRLDQPYIIVDDAVTTAGTMAALRSYIVRNGGTVIFATALASSTGKNRPFAVRPETVQVLTDAYGGGLNPFWVETVGHEVQCLTEVEGLTLGEYSDAEQKEGCPRGDALLQRLRARIDAAAT